mmetsp:Transcript_32561/g.43005  ORF Transcript_32561/g.43005 Transcript_32561/m.43005 type:complete len:99 (+) Transcript_32561:58-354(+)
MKEQHLIPTRTICSHYNIEISFVDTLYQMGLIQVEIVEENQYIHQDQVSDLEKIIRLHNDLDLSIEGIDIVLNLLQKEQLLRDEISTLKNRLRLYENI